MKRWLLAFIPAVALAQNPPSNATTINGASVPASQACVGTNSARQIITGTCSGGGGTPGGSDTQVQLNESAAFGGSSALTFTYGATPPVLAVTGDYQDVRATAAESFRITGRDGVTIPVPFFQPTTASKQIALDIMPKGTPANFSTTAGPAWSDICSTDIIADATNFECLRLTKLTGVALITTVNGGTGVVENIQLGQQGLQKIGIGDASPDQALTLNSSAATNIAMDLRTNGVTKGYVAVAATATSFFNDSLVGDFLVRGANNGSGGGGRLLLGSNAVTAPSGIIIAASTGASAPGATTVNGTLTPAKGIRTATASNTDTAGTLTLSGGTNTFTFTGTYTTAPVCVGSDKTAVAAVQVTASTTVLTINGTGTDAVNYHCIGLN